MVKSRDWVGIGSFYPNFIPTGDVPNFFPFIPLTYIFIDCIWEPKLYIWKSNSLHEWLFGQSKAFHIFVSGLSVKKSAKTKCIQGKMYKRFAFRRGGGVCKVNRRFTFYIYFFCWNLPLALLFFNPSCAICGVDCSIGKDTYTLDNLEQKWVLQYGFLEEEFFSSLKHSNINVGMSKKGYILLQIVSLKRGWI